MAENTGNTGATRVRRDVQSLMASGEHTRVLEAYASAIRSMRDLDVADDEGPPTNPLSWRFQAAIHGIRGANGRPLPGDSLWNACRHNSWFFFPWHRVYLYRFERIVQHHLGDKMWALPYWDYTKPDDEEARRLPAPFRDDSDGNPLYTAERNAAINDGAPVPEEDWDARPALSIPDFALPRTDPRPTFGGGIVEDVKPIADARGSLEGTPHGTVHGAIGGWMGGFHTAGLDPIFWLHHANIDRLWEVWLGLRHANPQLDTWLRTSFELFDIDGTRKRLSIADLLDTRKLGYTYESTAPPPGVARRPERVVVGVLAEEEEVPMPTPELVGAVNNVPFAQTTTVTIDLEPPSRVLSERVSAEDVEEEERWYLRVENVVGERPEASSFGVYLNVEVAGDQIQVRVGTVAAFGIMEASKSDDTHDGTGITDVFDITDAIRELEARGAWDAATARVTITPIGLGEEPASGGDVRAGRISFYRG